MYAYKERDHLVALIEEGEINTNAQLIELLEVKNILPNQEKHFKLKLDDIKNEYNDVKKGVEEIDFDKIKR